MKTPLVSIIMSVYNGSACVSEAIESILCQSFNDYEFIITDDGSTDGTSTILDAYARKDKRIRVIKQANAGLTESLNRMIKASKGEFMARMDADDVSMKERLLKQVDRLEKDHACAALGCWFKTSSVDPSLSYEAVFPDDAKLLKKFLRAGINCFAHGSVMMRKKALMDAGLCYRFRYGQDMDMWLRLSESAGIGMVEEVLYERRDHHATLSKSLVPRRLALARLMLKLSEERMRHGREITDWSAEEKKILKDVPLWGKKEIRAYDGFLKARGLLCTGKSREAKTVLRSIRDDLRGLGGFAPAYILSHLPGAIIGPALRWRDAINDKRQYKRKAK